MTGTIVAFCMNGFALSLLTELKRKGIKTPFQDILLGANFICLLYGAISMLEYLFGQHREDFGVWRKKL